MVSLTRHIALIVPLVASVGCGARTGLDTPSLCVELPEGGASTVVSFRVPRRLGPIDVVFLLDVSRSMQFALDPLRSKLRNKVAPAIHEASEDARLGVATFVDFPSLSGPAGGACGLHDDHPFRLITPLTDDVSEVEAGLDSIRQHDGGDDPESNVEAFYQLATGEGIEPWVRPVPPCPSGGDGYACFREHALPVILHFGDAPYHNGPGGSLPYTSCPDAARGAHSYEEAITALREVSARVISFYPTPFAGPWVEDFRRTAVDTQTVTAAGEALVFGFDLHTRKLGGTVVTAIRTFAEDVPLDIDIVLLDPDPFDGLDPRAFVDRVEAVAATPADGVERIDHERAVFVGVTGSTRVRFEIVLKNDHLPPSRSRRRLRLKVVFRAAMRSYLGSEIVEIVIPDIRDGGC